MKKQFKFALLGMTIVPLFGRVALHGTGHEDELFRFLMPMLVGGVAGFLIGLAKERLLINLNQFRSILDAVPYGVIQCDDKGDIQYANNMLLEMLKKEGRDFAGKPVWDLCLKPDERLNMQAIFLKLVQDKQVVKPLITSLGLNHGSAIKVEIHWGVHDNPETSFSGYTATIIDITSQIHSQRLLEKLSQVVEHADELIMITDRHGTIEYVNPALEHASGYSSQELIGENPSILKSPAQDPSVYEEMWKTISSGQVWRGNLIDRRKNGDFYPVNMSVMPIVGDNGKVAAYVSIQQDVSLQQELEEQLRQSQKMEALGTLVGGIAHDFNNMLAAIKGNSYLAKVGLHGETAKYEQRLNNIEQLVDQGADMIKQLLTFARKDKVEKQHFCLNEFMVDGYRLAKAVIPENIEHKTEFCQDRLIVYGNTTQFQQVMMNLVGNACDAVAGVENPRTSCSLDRFPATETFKRAHPDLRGSSFARISVSDNGVGIKKERITKIFEPFFTTKGVGEGTGLGLAMVFGAIKSHDGAIEVESEEGQGTTFHVYLPLSEMEVEAVDDEHMPVVSVGSEIILLADDDDALRSVTCNVLKSLGYQVIQACDGEEALQIYTSRQQEIALVITDVVMPRMGGFDLMKSIRAVDQNVPVIYITGYEGSSEQAKSVGEDSKLCCMIGKPFSIAVLSSAIRNMISLAD